ncbi:MAG: ATP synthase F0 subunit B [Polyangia bacterium]
MKTRYILLCVVLVSAAPVLAAADGGEEHGGDGIEPPVDSHAAVHELDAGDINWFDFTDPETPPLAAMIFNFALLIVTVYLIMRKPIGRRIKSRRQELLDALEEARRAAEVAERAMEQVRERSDRLDLEMARIRKDLSEAGKREAELIEQEAERRAERVRSDTDALVEQELSRMVSSIRAEIGEAVAATAERVLRERIGSADRERLAREYMESMDRLAPPGQGR